MFSFAKVELFPILFVCPELVNTLLSISKTAAFNSELKPKYIKQIQLSRKIIHFTIFINAMVFF